MMGALAGDMIGSPYEGRPIKTRTFPLFSADSVWTDDTVLTVATADALLHGGSYAESYRRYGRRYPKAGYGRGFIQWFESDDAGPYRSYGNGSAMRISPVGWFADSLATVMTEARKSAEVTHNHAEGIKGAQAVAVAIFLARQKKNKENIRAALERQFHYPLNRSLRLIRPSYRPEISCQKSVPEAILAFLESHSFEEAVRNAVSLGGDSDTQAAMAGSIAEAYYGGVPESIRAQVMERLDEDLLPVVQAFETRYVHHATGWMGRLSKVWTAMKPA